MVRKARLASVRAVGQLCGPDKHYTVEVVPNRPLSSTRPSLGNSLCVCPRGLARLFQALQGPWSALFWCKYRGVRRKVNPLPPASGPQANKTTERAPAGKDYVAPLGYLVARRRQNRRWPGGPLFGGCGGELSISSRGHFVGRPRVVESGAIPVWGLCLTFRRNRQWQARSEWPTGPEHSLRPLGENRQPLLTKE